MPLPYSSQRDERVQLSRSTGNEQRQEDESPVGDPKCQVTLCHSDTMKTQLERSIIIQTVLPSHLETLKKKISKVTVVDRFIWLAHNKLLAILPSLEDRDRLLNSKPHWCIKPWVIDVSPNSRRATAVIRGIPLPAWSESSYRSIAHIFGSLIEYEELSMFASTPEVRVTIDTTRMTTINDELVASFNGQRVRIGISEIVACHHQDNLIQPSTDLPGSPNPTSPTSHNSNSDHTSRDPSAEFVNAGIRTPDVAFEESQESIQRHGINLLLSHAPHLLGPSADKNVLHAFGHTYEELLGFVASKDNELYCSPTVDFPYPSTFPCNALNESCLCLSSNRRPCPLIQFNLDPHATHSQRNTSPLVEVVIRPEDGNGNSNLDHVPVTFIPGFLATILDLWIQILLLK